MTVDHINAAFELVGAVIAWRNVLQLYRDRTVSGVYWPAWLFFAAWGTWTLVFYANLAQWWSLVAGAALAAGHIAWVALLLWLRRSA